MKNKSIITIASTMLLSAACISVLAESIIFNPRATITYKEVSCSMQPVGAAGFHCCPLINPIAGNPDTQTLFKNDKTTGKPTTAQACKVGSDNWCHTDESVTIYVPAFDPNQLIFKDIYLNDQLVCTGSATYVGTQ